MNLAVFRFYAQLNDFIPGARKQRAFPHTFDRGQTVKHLIESLGVPHTEVDLILVNQEPSDFSYQVQDGDRVSVYPPFRSLDIPVRLRPPSEPRFILDNHLGRLAAYLRMLGIDTLYRNDYQDEELARTSAREDRILLTRDRGLLKRNLITHGYWLRETNPRGQLLEVLGRFDLGKSIAPFQRCLRCNGLLKTVPKKDVLERLQPLTRQHYDEFSVCQSCNRIYWRGSHFRRMQRLVNQVLAVHK